jgi:hypothetical protein
LVTTSAPSARGAGPAELRLIVRNFGGRAAEDGTLVARITPTVPGLLIGPAMTLLRKLPQDTLAAYTKVVMGRVSGPLPQGVVAKVTVEQAGRVIATLDLTDLDVVPALGREVDVVRN